MVCVPRWLAVAVAAVLGWFVVTDIIPTLLRPFGTGIATDPGVSIGGATWLDRTTVGGPLGPTGLADPSALLLIGLIVLLLVAVLPRWLGIVVVLVLGLPVLATAAEWVLGGPGLAPGVPGSMLRPWLAPWIGPKSVEAGPSLALLVGIVVALVLGVRRPARDRWDRSQ